MPKCKKSANLWIEYTSRVSEYLAKQNFFSKFSLRPIYIRELEYYYERNSEVKYELKYK